MPNYFGIVNGKSRNEVVEEIVKYIKDNSIIVLCSISYIRDKHSCMEINCEDCALSRSSKTLEGERRHTQVKDFLKL